MKSVCIRNPHVIALLKAEQARRFAGSGRAGNAVTVAEHIIVEYLTRLGTERAATTQTEMGGPAK